MSFDNPTNRGRALKIVDALAHVEKSAASNRATADEITEICAPVVEMLRLMGALPPAITLTQADLAAPPVPEAQQATPEVPAEPVEAVRALEGRETPLKAAEVPGGAWAADRNAPAWAIIRDAAASAPLSDIAAAMTVYATRMDDAIHRLKGAA